MTPRAREGVTNYRKKDLPPNEEPYDGHLPLDGWGWTPPLPRSCVDADVHALREYQSECHGQRLLDRYADFGVHTQDINEMIWCAHAL